MRTGIQFHQLLFAATNSITIPIINKTALTEPQKSV